MSKIALGTAQFGLNYGVTNKVGQVNRAEIESILELARRRGSVVLDTAVSYGASESVLGSFDLKPFQIVSKVSKLNSCDQNWNVMAEIEKSIDRLGVESIYAVLLHRIHDLDCFDGFEIWNQLQLAKEIGLVRKIGYSVYNPSELGAFFSRFPADIIQLPYNFLDKRFLKAGWIQSLANKGVELHVRSLFLQGVLLMRRPIELPKFFAPWADRLGEEFKVIDQTFKNRIAYCLAGAVNNPHIDRLVVGVESVRQFREIILAESLASSEALSWMPISFEPDEQLINPAKWKV
jgi:aryl-alcohol dehydrogenase-like predicted oxidoreductase